MLGDSYLLPSTEYEYLHATFIDVRVKIVSNKAIFVKHVQGFHDENALIIAQSPMENTVKDFLKMIVNYKVSAIVMLCELNESGKVDSIGINIVHYTMVIQEVCYQYWGPGVQCKQYSVECTSVNDRQGYTERSLTISLKEVQYINTSIS